MTELEHDRKAMQLTDELNRDLQNFKVAEDNKISAKNYEVYTNKYPNLKEGLAQIYSRLNAEREALFYSAHSNEERERALKEIDAQEDREVQMLLENFMAGRQ